ncbi:MAG: hypothetical protein AAF789_14570, partial [Bacteroidota bacterium]
PGSWLNGQEITQEINQNPRGTLARFIGHIQPSHVGKVKIFSNSSMHAPIPYHHAQAALYDHEGKPITEGSIQIEHVQLVPHPHSSFFVGAPQLQKEDDPEKASHYAQSWFGREVIIKVKNHEGQSEIDESVYIPKLLDLRLDLRHEGYLSVGDQLIWTPDERTQELLLSVMFFPEFESNASEREGTYFYKEILDNGSYTITAEDLAELPIDEGVFRFSVGRISFRKVEGTSSGKSYSLGGSHHIFQELKLMR